MKVGDLVSIKANVGLEGSNWGKTGVVLKIYTTTPTAGSGHPLCDIHFIDNGELRRGMSQALFEILNESQ